MRQKEARTQERGGMGEKQKRRTCGKIASWWLSLTDGATTTFNPGPTSSQNAST